MLFAFIALLFQVPANAPKLDADTQKLFAWYDSLGDNLLLSKPFVAVKSTFRHEMWPLDDSGFLLREDAKSFDILTIDHAIVTYTKVEKPNTYHHFEHEPLDFATSVRNSILFDTNPDKEDAKDQKAGKRRPMPVGTDCALAWLCYKKGLYAEMRVFLKPHREYIARVKTERNERRKNDPTIDNYYEYVKSAQRQTVERCEHKAIELFADVTLTRKDLLAVFEELAHKFKGAPYGVDLEAICSRLRAMIDEDKTHVVKGSTEEERITEMIWNLRNSEGNESRRSNDSADSLVKIGLPAAHQLIEAMTDLNFSRSRYVHRMGPPHSNSMRDIHTVGDIALDILEQMAGRRFYGEKREDAQRLARQWYLASMARGEEAVLIGDVSKGEGTAATAAPKLVEKYPNTALVAIEKGYASAKEEYVRRSLVQALRPLSTTLKKQFIYDVIFRDESLDVRMEAICQYLPIDALLASYRATAEWNRMGIKEYGGISAGLIVGIIFTAEDPTAPPELAQGLRKRAPMMKFQVLRMKSNSAMISTQRSQSFITSPKDVKFIAALEDLFASELDDSERWNGEMGGNFGTLSSPKLSTIAILSLSELLPSVYKFKVTKSEAEFESQRKNAIAIYKSRHKK